MGIEAVSDEAPGEGDAGMVTKLDATPADGWTWVDAVNEAFPDLDTRGKNIIKARIYQAYGDQYSLRKWIWSQDYLQVRSWRGVGPKFTKTIPAAVEAFRARHPDTQHGPPRCPHCGQLLRAGGDV